MAELFLDMSVVNLPATDAECVTTFLQLAAGDLTGEELPEWIAAHSRLGP